MNGKMLKRKVVVASISLALILLLTLPMVGYASSKPVQGQDRDGDKERDRNRARINVETRQAKGHNVPIQKTWTLNITATGTAFNMTDQSITREAHVTLNATVAKASMGRAKLEVTEGQLKIGNVVYMIEKGKGLIAVRNGKILIHLKMFAPNGNETYVVLKGKITGSLSSLSEVSGTVDVAFTKPQSKLVQQFFLELSGIIKRIN